MAEEILIRINLQSGEAKSKIDGVKKSTSKLAQEKKKLVELQKREAIEIAKVIEQQKIQRELNTKLAQSELGVGQAINRTTAALKTGRAQSGLNNAILLETSRLASDASFGFTAIANNLSQVINLFTSFAQTNGGVIKSLKELGKSILGTGGLLIGVQLLISFGPKLVKFFKELMGGSSLLKETFEKAGETVSDLATDFEVYIDKIKDSTESQEQQSIAIERLNKEFPDYIQQLKDAGLSLKDVANNTKDAAEQTEEYRKSLIRLALSRAAEDKIQELQAEKLNKIIARQLELNEAGLTEISLINERNKSIDEFTTVEEGARIRAAIRLFNNRKEHEEFIKQKEDEIALLLEYIIVQSKTGGADGDGLRQFKAGRLDFEKEMSKSRQRELSGFIKDERTKVTESASTMALLAQLRFNEFKANEQQRLKVFKSKAKTIKQKTDADMAYTKSVEEAEKSLAAFIIRLNEEVSTKLSQIDLKERQENLKTISSTEANLAKLADRATGLPKEFQTKEDEILKNSLQSQIGLQQRLVQTFSSGTKQRFEAEQELSRLLIELDNVTVLEREKKFKAFMKTFKDGYNAINGFSEAFSQIELNRVEAEYAQKIQAAANNTEAQAALQQELENKRDKIARRQFRIQKAANIARGLMDTYNTGIRAFGSQLIIGDPSSPIRAQIAQAAALASGLANVAIIASQKYQGTAGAGGTGAGTGGGREINVEAPDFNVVGASQVSQLAQSVSGQVTKPVKAFVVGKEITSQQELDRNINNTAGI